MTIHPIILVAIVLAALFLLTRGKKSKPAPSVPQHTGWHFAYSTGMPDGPTPVGDGFRFDFPSTPGSVHYVLRDNAIPLDRIAAKFTVTGSEFVPHRSSEDGDATLGPAMVSLIAYVGETRYYSRNSVVLAAGTFTLVASEWITVDGKPANPLTPDRIGLVFGWEAGRGHGVYGSGQFTLISM